MGRFFQNSPKFVLKLAQICKKIGKNWVILLKIWSKIGSISIGMCHFFLKNWYFVWVYFQIPLLHLPI